MGKAEVGGANLHRDSASCVSKTMHLLILP